jgi:hypothetical protein
MISAIIPNKIRVPTIAPAMIAGETPFLSFLSSLLSAFTNMHYIDISREVLLWDPVSVPSLKSDGISVSSMEYRNIVTNFRKITCFLWMLAGFSLCRI